MKRELMRVLAVTSVCVLGMASGSFAATTVGDAIDDGTVPAVKATTYSVGLGAAMIPDFEGSEDSKGAPVPFFRAQMPTGQYVQLLGATLSANILESNTWSVGPLVRYRAERNDDVENEQVKRLKKVDAAVELGAFVGWQANQWNARLDMAQDVADAHKGLLATLSGGYTFIISPEFTLGLNVSTTYASSDYMDTYFDVNIQNVGTSGINFYDADAGIKDVACTIIARYSIDKNWGLMGAVQLKSLVGDAADSTIVDQHGDSSQMAAAVLVTYKF